MAAAYYKVEVTLNSQAVSVGLPSPQSVSVTIPLIGPQGPVGATGSTGATGPANSLAIGAVSTGAAGSNASATITGTAPSQTLDLTIPRGDKGDTGDTGATGPANSLTIGAVSTGAAGSNADATITGTAPNQTLNLTIPVGATGATGPTGPQGPTIADANAPATNNILWQIRTTAFTAASGGRYVASGTFTVTNPASGNDGELFQVVVASGTVTVNSVAYGASRWPVTVARISGAWTTLPNTLTENLTLNGTNNTAPNQTAASGSSLITRDLGDARYALYENVRPENNQTAADASNFFTSVAALLPLNWIPRRIEIHAELEFTTTPVAAATSNFRHRVTIRDVEAASMNTTSHSSVLNSSSVTNVTGNRYIIKGEFTSLPATWSTRLASHGTIFLLLEGAVFNFTGGSLTLVNNQDRRVGYRIYR